MNLTIKLKSSLIRHGQSEVRHSNSVPAVGKLQSILKVAKEAQSQQTSRSKRPINEVGVPYLENTSATRSHVVFDGTFDGDFSRLTKHAYALANLASVDYNKLKLEYKEAKDQLQAKILADYPNMRCLPSEVSLRYQQSLHEKSFLIWKHQLTFIVWDTTEFEGGLFDKDRGIWVAATVSKSIYTKNPLTAAELKVVESGSDTVVSKVSRIVAKAFVRDIKDGKPYYRALKDTEDLDDFLD